MTDFLRRPPGRAGGRRHQDGAAPAPEAMDPARLADLDDIE
ncbi:hypothetical protein ACWEO4_08800 [Streptomyces sp. NPDC004393]